MFTILLAPCLAASTTLSQVLVTVFLNDMANLLVPSASLLKNPVTEVAILFPKSFIASMPFLPVSTTLLAKFLALSTNSSHFFLAPDANLPKALYLVYP